MTKRKEDANAFGVSRAVERWEEMHLKMQRLAGTTAEVQYTHFDFIMLEIRVVVM